MTPEEYYEFMTLIRNLRFKGIDTKPEDVENKYIRMAWRAVRPSVLKSIRNARTYENKKNKEQEEEPQVSTYSGTPLPPPPSRPKPPTSNEEPDYENMDIEEIAEHLYGIYLSKTDNSVYSIMNNNPYLRQHFNEVNAAYLDIKNKYQQAYV